jgi:hypothetical protein
MSVSVCEEVLLLNRLLVMFATAAGETGFVQGFLPEKFLFLKFLGSLVKLPLYFSGSLVKSPLYFSV